ncbi:Alpha-amylase A type-3 [Penicillium rolfsii]|nr:Alpha-amylase A type-3 [Penicillium rolfsii]
MSLWRNLFFAGLVGSAIAATPAQWRSQSIYFMLTDRFARTDGSTTAACNTGDRAYCGGTWQGIIDKLDYIQGMGFTAIWITPVTGQLTGDTGDGTAYHGYWQQDIHSLNSNYGTASDLKSLASALHDRGMYLMVDVVANHLGYKGAGTNVDYGIFDTFNSKDHFHSYCEITDYSNQTNVEDCWLGDTIVSLPDLNTESETVQNIWYNWVGSLVSNYSSKQPNNGFTMNLWLTVNDEVDGLRIDTVKHVQKGFWPGYNRAAGVYCVGEVFDGDAAYTCPYQEVMDGLLNYPMYYPLLRAFQSTSGSMSDLYEMINTVKSTCSDSTLLGTFVENHDNPRFASYTNDMSLAKNAAAFTIMADGIPIIYAGQEQHYSGGSDPANREAVWLSGYSTESELYKLIAKANAIRSHAINESDSYITYKNFPIYQNANTLAMRKGHDGTQTITILSNLGASGSQFTLSLGNTGYEAGTVLTEIVTCVSITVDSSGNVPVPMASGEPRIVYPSSHIKGSTICS